jgi:hypothetical protein
MRKINKTFKEIVTEIQYRDLHSNSNAISTIEAGVIYEDVAFHKLPRKFTDEIIKIVKEMKETKTLEKEVDMRGLFKLIKKSEVENFDQFFHFIQLLSNSSEKNLTIKLGTECNFIEPIELFEFSNQEYQNIFHDVPYENCLKNKIKNKNFSNALKIMKAYIHELNNLGTLTINPNLITDKMFIYDNDDTIIGHEIRHFIIFLQRWSKTNYEICRNYSIL